VGLDNLFMNSYIPSLDRCFPLELLAEQLSEEINLLLGSNSRTRLHMLVNAVLVVSSSVGERLGGILAIRFFAAARSPAMPVVPITLARSTGDMNQLNKRMVPNCRNGRRYWATGGADGGIVVGL
jgi:hypothetical protein